MKNIYISKYIILVLGLLFITTTCQREEELTLAEVAVKSHSVDALYTTANVACTFDCNVPFKNATVHYSTNEDFAEYNAVTMLKQEDGSWGATLTELVNDTRYYIRYEVSNRYSSMIAEQVDTFSTIPYTIPVVSHTSVVDTTATTASLIGKIESDGGLPILSRGICFSATSSEPTLADSMYIESLQTTDSFVCELTDLTVVTTYYARAYATNSKGTAYSNIISFTTLSTIAAIGELLIDEVGLTTATITSEVVSDGGSPVTERGVCIGMHEMPTTDDTKITAGTGIGEFTAELTELQRGTTYYVRAYAINGDGIAYSEPQSFTTLSTNATVVTAAPTEVGLTEATVGGEVTDDGGVEVTERGICYNNAPNPTIADTKIQKGTGVGSFTHQLTNLTMGATYYVRAYAINANGTVYGESIAFTTGTTTPSVNTSSITNVTTTSATVEGNILSDGGASITDRGICYSITNENPTTDDTKKPCGTGVGVFTCDLTDLELGTTYYVRAYATNSNGTQYGESKSFTTGTLPATVITHTPSDVTSNSAVVGGEVTKDGGADITEHGICYDTIANPTIDKNLKVVLGKGLGSFSHQLTNLQPGNTYYVRAYATTSSGTAYGEQVSFTTVTTVPVLGTISYKNVSLNAATIIGDVISDGGAEITERGICYGTEENPTVDGHKKECGVGVGSFTCNLTNLLRGTTYYVRAYAINSEGIVYSEQISFTTESTMATVTTAKPIEVTTTTAKVGGEVTDDGGLLITERGICYAILQGPTVGDTKVVQGEGVGTFTALLTGLQLGTTYYVRAYAINENGTAYGNEVSFTTDIMEPTVTTADAIGVAYTSATVGGEVTSDGGSEVTEHGICYSLTSNPTINNEKLALGSGIKAFSTTLENLQAGTTYYVRAYAINKKGIAYGEEISFSTTSYTLPLVTINIPATISYTQAVIAGRVVNEGASSVVERGICYSTSPNPTTADNKIAKGAGLGVFNCVLSDLTHGTTYYVRAYAVNNEGISYSEEVSFTTTAYLLPTLTIGDPYYVARYDAQIDAQITGNGGDYVTQYGLCYGTKPNPTIEDSDSTFVYTAAGIITKSYTLYLRDLQEGTTYYARAYAINQAGVAYSEEVNFTTKSTTYKDGYEYVDLGLPSGLKWATHNIGAKHYTEEGTLFAWGETEPKDTYSLGNYVYYYSDKAQYTKYCTDEAYGIVDDKTKLDDYDDAAVVNWGGSWRMPTAAEFQELINYCTWTKLDSTKNVQNYDYDRYDTYQVRGPNGNYIFLYTHYYIDNVWKRYAAYWSSNLLTSNNNSARAMYIHIDNDYPDSSTYNSFDISTSATQYIDFYNGDEKASFYRYEGKPIRPVCP